MKKCLTIILAALVALPVFSKSYTVFNNGKSAYTIVVAPDASASEAWAATELQHWLGQVSGVTIPVGDLKSGKIGKRIILGHNDLQRALLPDAPAQDANDESFTYCNVGGDILIYGGCLRGTMYGVFTFLENELGCRWYTSKDTRIVPTKKYAFTELYDHEAPGVTVRNDFYMDAFEPIWSARNKNNGSMNPRKNMKNNKMGGGYSYWGCHTMGYFIPAEKYFDEHPEYFSEIDGKRIKEQAQLCLSNPEVLQIITDKMRQQIIANPDYLIYDVSQNDYFNPCQCEKCREIKARYGDTESGIMVWFTNQVAAALKDEFPDKYFGTFAYQYTRTPPQNIRPLDNVVIRLCSIECCFLHDFNGCAQNADFIKDLEAWGKLAPHMYIWDYVTQFNQYPAPFANLYVLQPNIKSFVANNAIGIMEQGDYQTVGSGHGYLKQYLISKLLWNPDADVDAIINDFCYGYYGAAGQYVRNLIDEYQYRINDDVHQGCFSDCYHPAYDDMLVSNGLELFAKAAEAVRGNEELTARVELAFLPVFYLQGARNSDDGLQTIDIIKRICKREGITRFAEWGGYMDAQEFFDKIDSRRQ